MSDRTGKCMCGAVSFTVTNAPTSFGACHCDMCRRWTGSALLAMTVPASQITFAGTENISRIQSSDWAERAFCKRCGTGLWYKLNFDGAPDNFELPIGLYDDASDLTFDSEIFIDCKPDGFSYSGDRQNTMTRAEVFEKYMPEGNA